jgi:hypothetical protein
MRIEANLGAAQKAAKEAERPDKVALIEFSHVNASFKRTERSKLWKQLPSRPECLRGRHISRQERPSKMYIFKTRLEPSFRNATSEKSETPQ